MPNKKTLQRKKTLLFELKRIGGHGLGPQLSLIGNTIIVTRWARKKIGFIYV